jgi:hypothetical protein
VVLVAVLRARGQRALLGAVGLVPLFTGIFRFLPGYSLLGLNTCPMKKG